MVIERICPYCDKSYTLDVPEEGFKNWQNGMLIQRALPELSAEQRECIISGLCPKCQIKVFSFEEEDEEK